MKIALVVPGGVGRPGTHKVIPCLLWLIERLANAGDEVHVYALNQEPEPDEWELTGARIHNAGRRPQRIRAFVSLMREHRREGFDVVHAFWAGAPGQVASAVAVATGVPFIVTLPGGDLAALPDIEYGARLRLKSRIATRLVLSLSSAIISPSNWMAEQAAALGWKTVRCPFGVALDHWVPAAPRARSTAAPLRMINVATLNRVKDPFGLLDAMKFLAERKMDFSLEMIGEDRLDGAVQRHCNSLGLDHRVTFHGFVPNEALRPYMDRADLLVMNSRHETGPIVLLEAAAAGVPTVGTAVGSIADWAPEASVAVPVGDSAALAEAIVRLSLDEGERLRIANAAHAHALAYSADDYMAQLRGIYADLAAR